MALITCPECNSAISDAALDCPACGHPLQRPQRSFFGKLIKWTFILFNLFMLVVTFKSCGDAANFYSSTTDQYEQAGAAIGTTIGMGMLLIFWVFVDIILGLFVLFTRPKR